MGKIKQPLVSVIVPIYNVEQYLEECFDSLLSQTYENTEIILVDDGSPDASGKLADQLKLRDDRVMVVHKKNGGLSDARNAGMKIAKGEYITFVDSDDYLDHSFIETLVALVIENDADIVQCDNSRKPDKLGQGSGVVQIMEGGAAFVELMKYKVVSPTAWGKLYKRSLFTDNGIIFPVGRIHEDTAILYKLIYFAKHVACFNRVLYYYRVNENSIMTASYTDRHYESVVKYHDELDEFIVKNDIPIGNRKICRHKALRLLSVLNKLALHDMAKSDVYLLLKAEYIGYSRQAYDIICVIGVGPVAFPVVFRSLHDITPFIRKILGKS